MIKIPGDFNEFLYWFKDVTEHYWSTGSQPSSGDFKCEEGLYDARWVGLTDAQIDVVEHKYGIEFTREHRAFLRVLHTIHRKTKSDVPELQGQKSECPFEEDPYFYNWLEDDIIIKKYLDWPFQTILVDVLGVNNVWLSSWGKKPATEQGKIEVLTNWYQHAPRLLPLTGHVFVVSNQRLEKNPVLSVVGADSIIAGWSIQAYLIYIFAPALGLMEMKYSTEDDMHYPEYKNNALDIVREYFHFKLNAPLPYWDELILYYNGKSHIVE